MRPALAVLALGMLAGGCAAAGPAGQKDREAAPAVAQAPAAPPPALHAAVVDDATITDRIVAVVNDDAITLGELQEALVAFRAERRERVTLSDEELLKDFLSRLIDTRLQLQEADREKIIVEDLEIEEELADRMKKLNAPSREAFEAAVKAQGLSMDTVKMRLREAVLLSKVVRRKVALRVSVTNAEIETYFERNRDKLETGLSYHARHILVTPEAGPPDAAWESARIKAELVRAQLLDGADFAELARQHSRDASARAGGDLGALKRGELAEDIEAQILGLEPGEVSRPYRSRLGYHLFRLESRESLDEAGMMRVKQQIREILFREKYEARREAWLREIKQRAVIEVRM
ncbi:MAG: peptidylprolyl isomerase [Candidatus Rokuibacteriota bacterium]